MKPVIEVKGLSKSYIINHKDRASYSTIKDDFTNLVTSPFGKRESGEEKFWALKDINFEVKQGEIFGVIGKNGSGKSTLLKILSRIVDPTHGEIKLRGRTASLLEVGTGFHPELTGRENVYFNGSMLGMSRKEIDAKFEEIVAFSEIEKFIDTPVKFYSSGMYVRLAFAVAAFLDPDILILDEVLAVGDAAFQQKSLTKIMETIHDGKTVLFVSHSMGAVRQLCTSGVYLDQGKVIKSGSIDEIIEAYSLSTSDKIAANQATQISSTWENSGQLDAEFFNPSKVYITDSSGKKHTKGSLLNNDDYWINIEGNVHDISDQDLNLLNIGYSIWDQDGRNMLYLTLNTDNKPEEWHTFKKGPVHLRAKLPLTMINEGIFRIKIISSLHGKFWIMDPDSSQARIQLVSSFSKKQSPRWLEGRAGLFAPVIDWEVEQ